MRLPWQPKRNNEQKLPKGRHSRPDGGSFRQGQKWGTEPAAESKKPQHKKK